MKAIYVCQECGSTKELIHSVEETDDEFRQSTPGSILCGVKGCCHSAYKVDLDHKQYELSATIHQLEEDIKSLEFVFSGEMGFFSYNSPEVRGDAELLAAMRSYLNGLNRVKAKYEKED